MSDLTIKNLIFIGIDKVRQFFYKLVLGEVFIKQFKSQDQRSTLAKFIDLLLPTLILNLIVFIMLWSSTESALLSLLLCIILTVLFFNTTKVIRILFSNYLQSIYNLKEQREQAYNYLINLSADEFIRYNFQILRKLKNVTELKITDSMTIMTMGFRKAGVQFFYGRPEADAKLAKDFKNQLVSAMLNTGIIILNHPANKELQDLVKNYRKKAKINLIIIDIWGLTKLALTYKYRSEPLMGRPRIVEQIQSNANEYWDHFNRTLVIGKKRIISHLAVGTFLILFSSIITIATSLYFILGVVNIVLSVMALYNYNKLLNHMIPGNYDDIITEI